MERINYSSNSDKSRTETQEAGREKKEKIIDGEAKKTGSQTKKVLGAIIEEDAENIKQYIIWDVLLPTVRDGIRDVLVKLVEAVFGRRPSSSSTVSSVSYKNYNRISTQPASTVRAAEQNPTTFDDVVVPTRGDAERLLSTLEDIADQYGIVSVADMYDLAGINTVYTEFHYGWDRQMLALARIERTREGYILKMPRVKPLN